jgi:hypothetical protein
VTCHGSRRRLVYRSRLRKEKRCGVRCGSDRRDRRAARSTARLARTRGHRHLPLAREGRPPTRPGRRACRARPPRPAGRWQGRRRFPTRCDRPPGDRARRPQRPEALRPKLCADESAPHGRHGRAARRCAQGQCRPRHRAELHELALRTRRRTDQDRGRSARPHAGAVDAAEPRGDPASRAGSRRRGRSGAPLRRLLRLPRRRSARARAQATVPDRRRRRRHLVIRAPRRRHHGDYPPPRAGRFRPLQHRRRRASAGSRVAARARGGDRGKAAAPCPTLARPARRRGQASP